MKNVRGIQKRFTNLTKVEWFWKKIINLKNQVHKICSSIWKISSEHLIVYIDLKNKEEEKNEKKNGNVEVIKECESLEISDDVVWSSDWCVAP